jgi:ABC-2 type transport system permease protein
MSFKVGVQPDALDNRKNRLLLFGLHVWTIAEIEIRKLRKDPYELMTRAVQPILWLLVFGQAFGRLRAVPTGNVSYLAFLTPGILSQSITFISIFYGITIIWERDMGLLQKFLSTPMSRSALILGKMLAASVRALIQAVIICVLAMIIGVHLDWRMGSIAGVFLTVILGASFFAGLSLVLASLMRTRERMMGIGQLITMPLFFSSNALYPISVMPTWLKVVAILNPMSYLVDALRGLLLDMTIPLAFDWLILFGASLLMVFLGARLFRYRMAS